MGRSFIFGRELADFILTASGATMDANETA